MREGKEQRLGRSACDIWLRFDTLQSGPRIFPRAARPSDGTQRHKERARECEGAREEVTPHSSPNDSARLLRQLKQDTHPPLPKLSPLHQSCLLDHYRLRFTPRLAPILPKMPLCETVPFLYDKSEAPHVYVRTHTHTHLL